MRRRVALAPLALVALVCTVAVVTLAAQQFSDVFARRLCLGTALSSCNRIRQGAGSPESSVSGLVGDLYLRTNGTAGTTLYTKESGTGTTGWVGGNVIRSATVTLTDAQIKALPTTAITLVAAPASGFRIKPISATLIIKSSAGAYTNINTTYAALQIESTPGVVLLTPPSNDNTITPAMTKLTDLFGATTRVVDLSTWVNVPASTGEQYVQPNILMTVAYGDGVLVRVKVDNNGSGNWTGGNAANTMTVVLYYAVEPT